MCNDRRYYQWCHSPETEAKMKAEGWEYAGETGRYPSRLMSKSCDCDAEPAECDVLQDLGRACETHGCGESVRNDHEPSIPDLIAHDRAQRAEIERLRTALAKAEAERDDERMVRQTKINELNGLRAHYEQVCIRAGEIETRADRYLAAMRDAVRAYDRLAKGGYGGDLAVAWATLRAIVEEARRG